MKNVLKISFVFIAALVLFGCATPDQYIAKPIPKTSKIGVVSFMGNNANIVGKSSMLSYPSQKVALKGINIDRSIDNDLLKTLQKYGYQNVKAIRVASVNPVTKLTSNMAGPMSVNNQAVNYLKTIVRPGQYQTIVAVVPDQLQFQNVGKNLQSLEMRYGMVFVYRPFSDNIYKVHFFSAYRIMVLDGNTFQMIANIHGEKVKDVTGLPWPAAKHQLPTNLNPLKDWLIQSVIPQMRSRAAVVLKVGY